jgi:hypothetical protein
VNVRQNSEGATDMTTYEEFIACKALQPKPCGLVDIPELPNALKPFQREIVTWALRQGRCAVFAGTGLGKTLMQLSWIDAVQKETDGQVILMTPLAVAHQTVREAEKFGIEGVSYAKDHASSNSRIIISNYDRMEKFDFSQFAGFAGDESSILKSGDSATRQYLTEACKVIPYKTGWTATPAPNDYLELGQHAEFLGILTAKEMMATWFVHDGSGKATNAANHGSKPIAEWRLKGHAEHDFWRWLSTWAVVIRHPRDIGYKEPGYDLPPLHMHQVTVQCEYKAGIDTGMLFPSEARTLQEQRAVSRASIDIRVQAAADIVAANPDESWLVWCHLNAESEAIAKAIPGVVEIRGTDDPDDKIEKLLGFATGKYKRIVTKSKIAGMGMNYQICANQINVGMNNSWEALFQTIRRSWRFGQDRPVNIYMIADEREGAVVANLKAKEAQAEYMLEQMAEHMRDLTTRALKGAEIKNYTPHTKKMDVPSWLYQQ